MRRVQVRLSIQVHQLLKPARKALGADSETQLASDLIFEALQSTVIKEKLRRKYNEADLDGILAKVKK